MQSLNFCSELFNKIDAFSLKAYKIGYTTEIVNVADLLHNAENKSFILSSLHSLLPQPKLPMLLSGNLNCALIFLGVITNCITNHLSTDAFLGVIINIGLLAM